MKRYVVILVLLVVSVCGVSAQETPEISARFLPPEGHALLIIGQDLGAIGGLADYDDGYSDHIGVVAGGVTTYTGITDLGGLETLANWGAGDVSAQMIVDEAQYSESVLSIGLWLGGGNLAAIANGVYDDNIETLGSWIAAQDRPVFLRIGYEFDMPWNAHDPEQFVAVWRRIVDTFAALNVTNYATVWQSATAADVANFGNHEWMAWYPGDEYVDWFGISYFQHNFEIFDDFLNLAREHAKPVMIAESTPRGLILDVMNGEFIWEDWFAPFFDYIHENNDVIRAVAYINADWDAQSMWANQGWGDTRVQINDVVRERWLDEISGEFWLNASPELFSLLGYPESDD